MNITHAGAWSGIGGFELAARKVGWQNLFHCENNPFCQKVLGYHFPESELFPDINTADFTKYANQVTVFSSGFPCQPASTAGKRGGTTDVRWGWPATRRAYQSIKPPVLVFENVAGLFSLLEPESISEVERKEIQLFCENGGTEDGGRIVERIQRRVIAQILEDIKQDGYLLPTYSDGTPIVFCIPAAGVNAPHKRDRVWIIAFHPGYWVDYRYGITANGQGRNDWGSFRIPEIRQTQESGNGIEPNNSSFSQSTEPHGSQRNGNQARFAGSPNGYTWVIPNTNHLNGNGPGFSTLGSTQQPEAEVLPGLDADPDQIRQQGRSHARQQVVPGPNGTYSWCFPYRMGATESDSNTPGSGRGEGSGSTEQSILAQDLSDWRSFPTQPPVRSRNDELSMRLSGITISSHRRQSLKALGNAVVPAEVVAIFTPIDEYLKSL